MSPSTPPGLTTTMTTMTSTRHMSSAVSFDRAGSSSLQQLPSSSRLPSYRSSYCGRYHPYGRPVSRKDKEVDLMKTIDMRFDNRASLSLSVVDEEDEDELEGEGEDVEIESTTAVSPSNEGGDYQPPTSHRLGKPIMARRRTLTNIVIEFAFAMRRSLQRKKPNLLFSKRS